MVLLAEGLDHRARHGGAADQRSRKRDRTLRLLALHGGTPEDAAEVRRDTEAARDAILATEERIIAILVGQKFDLPNIDAILNIVVITVACSVVLHGLTAWPGSQRYGRWIAAVGLGPLARYEEPSTPTTEP